MGGLVFIGIIIVFVILFRVGWYYGMIEKGWKCKRGGWHEPRITDSELYHMNGYYGIYEKGVCKKCGEDITKQLNDTGI